MFAINLFKITARMCRITPEIYQKLYKSYTKVPHASTFGKYYNSKNLIQIFNIIKYADLKNPKKMQAYAQLTQLCNNQSDMQLNVFANIMKQRAGIYSQQRKFEDAVKQIQQSIKLMALMQQPFELQFGNLLNFAANLYINVKNFEKAEKYLRDADFLYNQLESQVLQNPQIPKQAKQQLQKQVNQVRAKLQVQICILLLSKRQLFQAKEYVDKANQRWKKIQIEKRNNLHYLLLMRSICSIHFASNQKQQAVRLAREYLQKYESKPETQQHLLYFKNILAEFGGERKYDEQIKKSIQDLQKVMSQEDIQSIFTNIGFQKNQKPDIDSLKEEYEKKKKETKKEQQIQQQKSQQKTKIGRRRPTDNKPKTKDNTRQNINSKEEVHKTGEKQHKKEQKKEDNKQKNNPNNKTK